MIGNYSDFLNYIESYEHNDFIPKIIYRTGPFNLKELPKEIHDIYTNDLNNNAEYSLFYFDDIDCQSFISDFYGAYFLQAYNSLIPNAYKADLFRYMILYEFGGVWMDFSMSLNIPLKDIIGSYKQIYVRDRIHLLHHGWQKNVSIYQGFLCSVKNNKVLKLAIHKCLDNIKDKNLTLSCLAVTGPILLGTIYRELEIDGTKGSETMKIGKINDEIYVYQFEYEHENVILDQGREIITIKHPKHQSLLYNNKDHYGEQWNQKKVFL